MLTLNQIRTWNDWAQVVAWALACAGIGKALFNSFLSNVFMLWLSRWNHDGKYERLRKEVKMGAEEKLFIVPDQYGRQQEVTKFLSLKPDAIAERQAEIKALKRTVWLMRFIRVPFECEFCAYGESALLLLAITTRYHGLGWLLANSLFYGMTATALGMVIGKFHGHARQPQVEPVKPCNSPGCGDKAKEDAALAKFDPPLQKNGEPYPLDLAPSYQASRK